jgi:ActR/RegA family two-component response regulator
MTGCRQRRPELASMGFMAVCAPPVAEGIKIHRKVLVVSSDTQRLNAALGCILDRSLRCAVARDVNAALAKLREPEIGFVVIDGDDMIQHLDTLLAEIKRLRPDINDKQKLHVFTCLEDASAVGAYFRTHAQGIEPLTWSAGK